MVQYGRYTVKFKRSRLPSLYATKPAKMSNYSGAFKSGRKCLYEVFEADAHFVGHYTKVSLQKNAMLIKLCFRKRERGGKETKEKEKKNREREKERKLCSEPDQRRHEVTEGGLSVSSLVSLRVQSILPPYRTDHFRGARRHALTLPHRRQPVGKNFAPSLSFSHPSTIRAPPFLLLSILLFFPRATRGFTTTIFTGLQTNERFSLKPIRLADDSRYTFVYFVSPSNIDAMQRDAMKRDAMQ